MVIVLIRRCVKPDKEGEFLSTYKKDKPEHPGFIREYLTKLDSSQLLPEPMRSLLFGCKDCVTYLNIAHWKSADAFHEHFDPKTMHDSTYECSDRLRAVCEIIQEPSN